MTPNVKAQAQAIVDASPGAYRGPPTKDISMMTHHERLEKWAVTAPNNSWTLPVTKQDAMDLVNEYDKVRQELHNHRHEIYEAESEQITRPLREQLAKEKEYHNKWVADHQIEIDRAHRTKREAEMDRDAARLVSDQNAMLCRDAEAKVAELRTALEFYAAPEHWMASPGNSDGPRNLLVAYKGSSLQGWVVAQQALIAPMID